MDIEQAESHARPNADVIVASIPTIARRSSNRLSKFNPKDFKMIIIDEAHHTAADSYLWTLDHFGVLNQVRLKFKWITPEFLFPTNSYDPFFSFFFLGGVRIHTFSCGVARPR